MKNTIKVPLVRIFGIIALVAVIGFSFAACSSSTTDGEGEEGGGIKSLLFHIIIGIVAIVFGFAVLKGGDSYWGLVIVIAGVIWIVMGVSGIASAIVGFFRGLFGG